MPIAVVVQERAAGTPRLPIPVDSADGGDIGEPAVTVVPEQGVPPPIRDVNVVEAAVGHIAYTDAAAPTRAVHPCLERHVPEFPTSLVAVKVIDGRRSGVNPFEFRAVDEENILPAVAIVVKECDAGPVRFEN